MQPMYKYEAAKPHKFRLMSRDEVRAVDAWAVGQMGIPGVVLMENAGCACAEAARAMLPGDRPGRAVIFCGIGNNGGDGFVIARHLANAAVPVRIVVCGDPDRIVGDARVNFEIVRKMNLPIEVLDMLSANVRAAVKRLTADVDLVVDAIFGTGLTGALRGGFDGLIAALNAQRLPTLAVDIPSGLDCDTGEPLGAAVEADATVTFVAVKKGFSNPAARRWTGDVYVASIGIEPPPRQP